MEILQTKRMLCACCVENHDVQIVRMINKNLFKNTEIEYWGTYYYCDKSDEFYTDEAMMIQNDISMKDAYRSKKNLLTTNEIQDICRKYSISQNDLFLLLGWNSKIMGHQVQDAEQDAILRQLAADPKYFLFLLKIQKTS